MERVRTGVPSLDALLGGGFRRGDAVLVKGGPGAGKTVLGVQWICRGAADYGEPGVIIVLEETPQQFYRRAQAFGWDLRKLEEQNKVRIIFTSAEALSRDILTGSLLVGMLAEIGARRVAIDPITHYRLIFPDESQLRQQVYATINALKRLGQTSLLVAEMGSSAWTGSSPEEYLADAVISLGDGPAGCGTFRRLEIAKSSSYDHQARSALFRVTPAGIHLVTPMTQPVSQQSPALPTGLSDLYEELSGNSSSGSFCLVQLETNVRRVLLDLSLMAFGGASIETVIHLGNSCVSPGELWDLAATSDLCQLSESGIPEKQRYLLEPFGRRRPATLPATHFRSLVGYDGDKLISFLSRVEGVGSLAVPQGSTLVVCDIGDLFYHVGQAKFQMLLPRLVDAIKSQRALLVGLVDPRLMTPESHAWVQSIADGIIRLWDADGCRFVAATKGPNPASMEPKLFVETAESPFLHIID